MEKDEASGSWGIPAWNDAPNFNNNYSMETDAEKRVLCYFKYEVETSPLNPKKKFKVPHRWLSRAKFFLDEVFLSTVDLSSTLTQGIFFNLVVF